MGAKSVFFIFRTPNAVLFLSLSALRNKKTFEAALGSRFYLLFTRIAFELGCSMIYDWLEPPPSIFDPIFINFYIGFRSGLRLR